MTKWRLGVAALALCTGLGGAAAWGQNGSATKHDQNVRLVQTHWQEQQARKHDQNVRLVQTRWQEQQDRDHDRDNRDRDNRDRNWKGRDHNRDRDRDRDRNNGYYGNGNYGYRNGPYNNGPYYGNGGYRAYPSSGPYGYYGRGGYGNNAAAQMGFQDGLNYGRNDASRGKGYNATGSEAYENADRGYNSNFGDKGTYRQEYRQAYQQGYNQGYNGGGYRR